MPRIAFYTFGILHESFGHPQVQEFFDRLDSVFAQARNSEGYIYRDIEPPSVNRAAPRFYDKSKHAAAPATLSLWKDLESVCAFAYKGLHAEALKIRSEWFVKPEWPTYVAWWVDDHHIPTREEASRKLEHLHDNGPSAAAFNFKQPFDAEGKPVTLNKKILDDRVVTNESQTGN